MLFELVVFPQAAQWGLVIHWKSLQGSPALHSQPIWNAPFRQEGDSPAPLLGREQPEPSCRCRDACSPSELCLCKKFRHSRRLPGRTLPERGSEGPDPGWINVQVCKSAREEIGKFPGAKGERGKAKSGAIQLQSVVTQERRDFPSISPRGWRWAGPPNWSTLEDSFFFQAPHFSNHGPDPELYWESLPAQGRRSSPETPTRVCGCRGKGEGASYLIKNSFTISFPGFLIRPESFRICITSTHPSNPRNFRKRSMNPGVYVGWGPVMWTLYHQQLQSTGLETASVCIFVLFCFFGSDFWFLFVWTKLSNAQQLLFKNHSWCFCGRLHACKAKAVPLPHAKPTLVS